MANPPNKSYFVTGDKTMQGTIDKFSAGIQNSKETMVIGSGPYLDYEPNINVRPSYDFGQWDYFRPNEAVPKKMDKIMSACRTAYEKVGLIKAIIDLMVEMAVDGIEISSDDPSVQNFYDNWSKRVNLQERAEKFADYLLIEGNVVLRRKMAAMDTAEIRTLRRNQVLSQTEVNPELGLVPVEYLFYDPGSIEVIGESLALFIGKKRYGLKISHEIVTRITADIHSKGNVDLSSLPEEIRSIVTGIKDQKLINSGRYVVLPLPENRIYVEHSKKRDTDLWAKSFIYSLLQVVIYNEKLRLAKISALDGYYNPIRLWKLGDHKEKIFPTEAEYSRLANMLTGHTNGSLDLIWHDMIDMEPFYPPVEKLSNFSEDFESILLGAGIPKSIAGGFEAGSSSSNFIGIKNLVKRINTIRRAVKKWVEHEVDTITTNMNFRKVPVVSFAFNDIFDQQTYFKILTDLVDRQIISDETVIKEIGRIAQIERSKIKNEEQLRSGGELPAKLSPLYVPAIPEDNQAFQKEMARLNHRLQMENQAQQAQANPPKSKGKAGRPAGARDGVKRVRKFKTRAEAIMLANRIQDKIDQIFDSEYLVYNQIDNKRQLTALQRKELDQAKLEVFAYMVNDDFNSLDDINSILSNENINPSYILNYLEQEISTLGPDATAHDVKTVKSSIFAEVYYVEDNT